MGVGGRGEVQLTARREEDAVNLRPPEGTHELRLGGASLRKSHESSREREREGERESRRLTSRPSDK